MTVDRWLFIVSLTVGSGDRLCSAVDAIELRDHVGSLRLYRVLIVLEVTRRLDGFVCGHGDRAARHALVSASAACSKMLGLAFLLSRL